MSENATSSVKTRHMDTRYRYVEAMQKDGLIKLEFVPTKENVSDVATKNVTGEIMERHNKTYLCEKETLDG